ncbi:hypothetical protein [Burkholderia alba]|uniref:hypothetical protein n=1 Tax=Burkholderia alba TaxID=2683677 RepID=UPI002B052E67|nr:hypothetical protein [Burkholderia alba]
MRISKRPKVRGRPSPVRTRSNLPGWLRVPLTGGSATGRYWCDICQISDAMFEPFVEAIASRLAGRQQHVAEHARVLTGQPLAGLGSTVRDTGLRVLGQPVWRVQETGAYVCEAVPGEGFLLTYQPHDYEENV